MYGIIYSMDLFIVLVIIVCFVLLLFPSMRRDFILKAGLQPFVLLVPLGPRQDLRMHSTR